MDMRSPKPTAMEDIQVPIMYIASVWLLLGDFCQKYWMQYLCVIKKQLVCVLGLHVGTEGDVRLCLSESAQSVREFHTQWLTLQHGGRWGEYILIWKVFIIKRKRRTLNRTPNNT